MIALLAIAPASALAQSSGDVFDQFFRYTNPGRGSAIEEGASAPVDRLPGESIDPFTGTLRVVREDLVLPGKAGLDLRIMRTYSSKIWGRADLLEMEPLLAENEHSVLGYGWSFHMGRLRGPNSVVDPLSICGGSYPVYEAPDGSTQVFYPVDGGVSYVSTDYWRLDTNCTITGGGLCMWSSTGVLYELSSASQYYIGMTPILPVTAIVDPFGNRISVHYVDQTGAPDYVTDTYGRTVTFSYDSDVDGLRLRTIVANGRTYSFSYDTQGTATDGTGKFPLPGPRRFLTSVQPPAGPPEGYDYGFTRTVEENQYALSQITYPGGAVVRYGYGTVSFFTGRESVPFSVVRTRTLEGPQIQAGTWTYDYVSPGYATYSATDPATGHSTDMHVTTVTRPDGLIDTFTIYGFGWVADQNDVGYTYLVGRTFEAARANRAEVERMQWNPRVDALLAPGVVYAAPVYSQSCGAYFVWDDSVSSPVVDVRGITRDGVTSVTAYSDFDPYGQPRTVTEYVPPNRKVIPGTVALPLLVRTGEWTYFSEPVRNVVRGYPLTRRVCVGADCVDDSWTYSPAGRRTSETLSGVRAEFEYYTNGDLYLVRNALGQELKILAYQNGVPSSFDFNGEFAVSRMVSPEGWIMSETNGRGYTTSYDYDGIGRLKLVTPPGPNNATGVTYAPDNSWVREARGGTPSAGEYFKNTYLDGLGRPVSTSNSEDILASSRYDVMGWRWFTSNPYDSSTGEAGEKTERDGLGRLTVITKGYRPASNTCDEPGACSTTFYREAGCVRTQVDRKPGDPPATTWRCNWYYGDPDDAQLLQVGDAELHRWEYRYTAAGKLSTVTAPDAKGNRSYGYDARQFLTSETSGESGTVTYGRDAVGQVTSRTDARAAVATYDRNDRLGRIVGILYAGAAEDDVVQRLNASNGVTHMSSSSGGTFDYDYDELDRLSLQTWTWSNAGQNVQAVTRFHHDAAGCPDSVTYPSGTTLTMTCDTMNRVTSIRDGNDVVVSDVLYHPSGQPRFLSLGNGLTTYLDYDDRGRMSFAKTTLVTSSGTSIIVDLRYGYDGADNLVSFEDRAAAGSARTMTYDGLDRIVTSSAPNRWGDITYRYDALGNRTFRSGSIATTYTYDSQNRLAAATAPETFQSMTFNWDVAGRLVWSSDGTSYRYDGRGRRVRKVEGGEAMLYHYDAAGRVLAESAADGAKLRDYVYLGNTLLAVDGCLSAAPPACTERQWYHTDSLGSVRARTDSLGMVVAQLEYQPWGEQAEVVGTAGDRQYNGRVYDPGTGFHDYGARMYWPQVGRFISADTNLGSPADPRSLNRYSYVLNNPYKYVDPSGRDPVQSRILNDPRILSGEYLERSGLGGPTVGDLSNQGQLRDALAGGGARLEGMQQSEQNLLAVEQGGVDSFLLLVGVGLSAATPNAGTEAPQAAGSKLSPEAQRGIRSLDQRIAEHEQKLADFKANPTVRPGMEKLPAEVIRKQQQTRIRHLETEIQTFKDNIDKLKGGGQ